MARKKRNTKSSRQPASPYQAVKNRRKEDKLQTGRNLRHIMVVFMILVALVISNVFYTMFAKRHLWSQISALSPAIASSIINQTVNGKRGTIYDRNHAVLAQETPAYTIVAQFDTRDEEEIKADEEQWEAQKQNKLATATEENRAEVRKEIQEEQKQRDMRFVTNPKTTAIKIASVLKDSVSRDYLEDLLQKGLDEGKAQIELGSGTKRLEKQVMEQLVAAEIPGISFIESTRRSYPSTPFASNLIGFSSYSEDSQSISGVMGMERTLDLVLDGTDGQIQFQQSRAGNVLPGTTRVLSQAKPGDDIVLTLDSNLQQIVEQQMQITMETNNAQKAWCLVMEVETGKILAWASYPSFDQNTHLEIPSYTDNISEMAYEPGSVMKPFVYAAAVDAGVFPYNTEYRAGEFAYTYNSTDNKIIRQPNGTITGNPTIRDALGNDFGVLTFEDGLAYSSNVAICELLANYLDQKTFEKYLDNFHFYQSTEIPYVNEIVGSKNISDPSSYLSTGFGQASSISILQLAQAYTAIFNDGVMMQPYVLDSIVESTTGTVLEKYEPTVVGTPISAKTADTVLDMMVHVVDPGFSGDRFAMDGVDLAAKTGTGEIYNPETGAYDTQVFTSSVMAAAPADDPKIMVYWGMVSANYINYSSEPFKIIMNQALIANSVNGGTSQTSTSPYEKWESYTMPSLINHSTDYALSQMEDKKVNTVVIGDGANVIDQFPKAGTVINSNDNVLLLTDGDVMTMPDLIGWTRKDLTAFWQLTGISIMANGYGTVSFQSVAPDTPISTDTQISVDLQ